MAMFTFENDQIPANAVFRVLIQTAYADADYDESFTELTTFSLVNNKVTNYATTMQTLDQGRLHACVPAVAPFYYGSQILSNTDFIAPSIEFIAQQSVEFSKALEIDHDELIEELADFKRNGVVDFAPVQAKIRKICLTTPTPSPRPTPRPTPEAEDPEDPEMNKGLFSKWRRHHRRHYHKKQEA